MVDSVAALTPRAEIEGDMGDSHVGLLARLMSQALRKLAGSIAKTNCIVIFINQLREKVGVMYGNPEVTLAASLPWPMRVSPMENQEPDFWMISSLTARSTISPHLEVDVSADDFDDGAPADEA